MPDDKKPAPAPTGRATQQDPAPAAAEAEPTDELFDDVVLALDELIGKYDNWGEARQAIRTRARELRKAEKDSAEG